MWALLRSVTHDLDASHDNVVPPRGKPRMFPRFPIWDGKEIAESPGHPDSPRDFSRDRMTSHPPPAPHRRTEHANHPGNPVRRVHPMFTGGSTGFSRSFRGSRPPADSSGWPNALAGTAPAVRARQAGIPIPGRRARSERVRTSPDGDPRRPSTDARSYVPPNASIQHATGGAPAQHNREKTAPRHTAPWQTGHSPLR